MGKWQQKLCQESKSQEAITDGGMDRVKHKVLAEIRSIWIHITEPWEAEVTSHDWKLRLEELKQGICE